MESVDRETCGRKGVYGESEVPDGIRVEVVYTSTLSSRAGLMEVQPCRRRIPKGVRVLVEHHSGPRLYLVPPMSVPGRYRVRDPRGPGSPPFPSHRLCVPTRDISPVRVPLYHVLDDGSLHRPVL